MGAFYSPVTTTCKAAANTDEHVNVFFPDPSPPRSNPRAHGPRAQPGRWASRTGAGRNGSVRASGETKPRKPGKKVRTEIPPSWEFARVPGKEAQMKGGAAGGKQAVRTEGQLFAARPGAAAGQHCRFVR